SGGLEMARPRPGSCTTGRSTQAHRKWLFSSAAHLLRSAVRTLGGPVPYHSPHGEGEQDGRSGVVECGSNALGGTAVRLDPHGAQPFSTTCQQVDTGAANTLILRIC